MCRCPLHQRSCRGTIVFPCGNLIRITQRDCAARWLVCIDVSCWLDSNTYVLGGTSLKALCQSGVWKKQNGNNNVIDETSGLPLNTCSYTVHLASFKRINGVVYGKLFYISGNTSTAWFSTFPITIPSVPIWAVHFSGNIYGLYNSSGSGLNLCYAYVP